MDPSKAESRVRAGRTLKRSKASFLKMSQWSYAVSGTESWTQNQDSPFLTHTPPLPLPQHRQATLVPALPHVLWAQGVLLSRGWGLSPLFCIPYN